MYIGYSSRIAIEALIHYPENNLIRQAAGVVFLDIKDKSTHFKSYTNISFK